MHIWHHDESHPKGSAKNFGINLSLWDWIFGTLYQSDTAPKEIGNKEDAPEKIFTDLLKNH